jgi:hypothetical protein
VREVPWLPEVPDDPPEVPWLPEVPDDVPDVPWLAEAPDEDPAEVVVGEEAVLVVVVVVAVVVVELPDEGTVVVAEPAPGAEPAGAEICPGGEMAPAPGVLGALPAVGFAEEDGAGLEEEEGVLAVPVGGAPAAAASAPDCDPGSVAPATGLAMPDTSGSSGERGAAGCVG